MFVTKKPQIMIGWFEEGEFHYSGPYYTIYQDGSGAIIGQDWVSYKVQTEQLAFKRITVPECHYITTC